MVMTAFRPSDVAFLGLDLMLQHVARHRAAADLGLGEEEIDHLVLEQRRPQLRRRHRFLAVILDELLAVGGLVLMRGRDDALVHLLLRHLDAILLTDLRTEEHTSSLQSLMRISYAVFSLQKK